MAPPLRVAEFDITNDEGISKAGGLLDVAVDLGIIEKKGSFFSYEGKPIAQGREAAKVFIAENEKLSSEIEKKIRERLESGESVPKEIGEVSDIE